MATYALYNSKDRVVATAGDPASILYRHTPEGGWTSTALERALDRLTADLPVYLGSYRAVRVHRLGPLGLGRPA